MGKTRFQTSLISVFQVVILDVRVPCTPVARLNNHRACVNGIAWAPHSSCHICTAGNRGYRTQPEMSDLSTRSAAALTPTFSPPQPTTTRP